MTIQQPELDEIIPEGGGDDEPTVQAGEGPEVAPLWPLVRYGRVYGAPGK